MTAQTLPKPDTPVGSNAGKPALHMYCGDCYPQVKPGDVAVCGHVCTCGGHQMTQRPADWPLCVVCRDLVRLGCAKCGAGR